MKLNYQDSLESFYEHTQVLSEKNITKPTLKQRKAARRARQLIGKNKGRWALMERRQYYVFLKIYYQFFVSKDHRRNDKVFRMMANFIKTRTPDQCRTHHQKIEFKYHKISKIIDVLKNEFGQIDYQEILKKCELESTIANTPTFQYQRDATFNQTENELFVDKKLSDEILQEGKIFFQQFNLKKAEDVLDKEISEFQDFIPSFNKLID